MKCVRISLQMRTVVLVGLRFVWAHEGATGITKQRMDSMESMSKAMKAIRRCLEGNRNIAAIQAEAERIRELAIRIPQWFPTEVTPSRPMPCQQFGNAGRIFRRGRRSLKRRVPSWRR